jgi:DNA-binding Lrp family transcriptional regulator
MTRIGTDKRPFLDSLDREIIEAVRYEQFMTCREIWAAVKRNDSAVSPSLVYRRANNLVDLGVLGCIEKNLGDAVLRRYYCFQDPLGSSRDNYSFIENL